MIGSRAHTVPLQIVPISTRISSPVGIEISSVVSMNGPFSAGAQPAMYMWWAQTNRLSPTMPAMPITAVLKLNSGLRVKTGVSSMIATKAGSRMT